MQRRVLHAIWNGNLSSASAEKRKYPTGDGPLMAAGREGGDFDRA